MENEIKIRSFSDGEEPKKVEQLLAAFDCLECYRHLVVTEKDLPHGVVSCRTCGLQYEILKDGKSLYYDTEEP